MPKRSIKYGIGYVRSRGKYLYGEYYHRGKKFRKAVHSWDEGKAWLGKEQAQLLHIGYTLSEEEIARIGVATRRLPDHVGISDLVDFYLAHHPTNGPKVTVANVVDNLISDRENAGLRHESIIALKWRLKGFKSDYGDLPVSTISAPEIDDWLDRIGAKDLNRKNYKTYLNQLFNYARRMGYCPTNPVERLNNVVITPKTHEVLTVDQVASVINVARKHRCGRYFAVGLFCGARNGELKRLDEDDIRMEDRLVSVRPEIAKKRRQRFITISDNLYSLFANCGETGPVGISKRMFNRVRREAGIENWPYNAMRHSFASYHLAYHQDAAKTAYELGHVSPALVYDHYRLLVTKEEAAKYWQIK